MPLSVEAIISYILGALVLILLIWVIRLEMRLRNFTRGKSGASLEDTLSAINKMLDRLFAHGEKVEKRLGEHDMRLKRSIQGVATVRFNPFDGTGQGGNQSFATAFLNEEGTGIVVSTLYSRDKVRVFGKPVKTYVSLHELSTEEQKAIEDAKASL